MPLFDSLITTFKDSLLVARVGSAVYSALITFWVAAVKHYRARGKKRFRSIFQPSTMNKKFVTLRSELDRQAKLLNEVSAAQHYINNAVAQRKHEEEAINKRRQKDDEWLAKNLVAPDSSSDHKNAKKKHYDRTCEWICAKQKYKRWQATTKSPPLVIYGKAGAGKTILSSFLIDRINSSINDNSTTNPPLLLYHYFKLGDETKNTPIAATRSLIQQLHEKLPENGKLALLQKLRTLKRLTDYEDLWMTFTSIIDMRRPEVIIVLDALDECKSSKRFVRDLKNLNASYDVKLLITAREHGEHYEILSTLDTILIVTADDVSSDIASFVRYKVSKIERLQNPEVLWLKEKTVSKLIEKEQHEGLFLWAYFMCKELKRLGNPSDIEKLVGRLPKDLKSVYINIIERLSSLSKEEQEFSQLVLRWLVISDRALQFQELEHALQIQDPSLVPRRAESRDNFNVPLKYRSLLWSRKDIVRLCGSLVSHSGVSNGDTIGLIHLTTREFLSSSDGLIHSQPSLEAFFVDLSQARITAGITCLHLLSSREIQDAQKSSRSDNLLAPTSTSLTQFTHEYPLFGYSVEYWPQYVLDTAINALENPTANDLIRRAESFLKAQPGRLWLEYYMYQHGFEAASNTFQRFIEALLDQDKGFPELLALATDTRKLLNSYSVAFSRMSRAVLRCLPNKAIPLETEHEVRRCQDVMFFHTPKYHSVFRQCRKTLIHFNVDDGSLFWMESGTLAQIYLHRDTMHGLKYRSVICPGEENLERRWRMVSAVVSPCGRYIATSFVDHPIRLLRTVLWLVRTDDISKTTDTWAEVKIIDDVELKGSRQLYFRYPRSTLISFWDEDIFVTLGGIWSIKREKKVGRPANIFQSESLEWSWDICLSKNRVARVKDRKLEVLEICNENDEFEARLVMETDLNTELETEWEKTKSESWRGTSLLQFSASAQKLVVKATGRKTRCLILEGPCVIRVDLTTPTYSEITTAVFTADESRIIGCDSSLFYREFVAVWTIKQQNGQYCESADILYLFQCNDSDSDFDFIYFPGTIRRNEGVIIVTTAGEVIQRDLSTKPFIPLYEIPGKPQSVVTVTLGVHSVDCKIIKQGSCIRFNRITLERYNRTIRNAFVLEIWCISKALKKLSFFELPNLPTAFLVRNHYRFSPFGQYVITDFELFHYADGALSDPIQLPESSRYISVSPDDKFITCMTYNGGAAVFHMLQARQAQSPLVAAIFELKNWRDPDRPDGEVDRFASTFHDTAPHLILLSYKLSYKNTDTESAFTVALKYEFGDFQSFLVTGIFLPM